MTGSEPQLDPFATARAGRPLEDLSRIPDSQPYRTQGPAVPYRGLALLHSGLSDAEPVIRASLIDADLITADDSLTESGQVVADTWADSRVQIVVNAFIRGERTALEARVRGGHCVVAAGPSVASVLAGDTVSPEMVHLNVAAMTALPLLIASWVALAPAWQFAVAPDRLPAALVDARVREPHTPCPPDADESLQQAWAQPWVDWRIQTTPSGRAVGYLSAGTRGQFVTWVDGEQRALDARPPMHVWRDLLRLIDSALQGSD